MAEPDLTEWLDPQHTWMMSPKEVRRGDMILMRDATEHNGVVFRTVTDINHHGWRDYVNRFHIGVVITTMKSERDWPWSEYPQYGWQDNDEWDGPDKIMPYDCTEEWYYPEDTDEQLVVRNFDVKLFSALTRKPIRWWVAVYEVGQGYGGAEEGGWWFDTGDLQAKYVCETEEQAEALRDALRDGEWEDESNVPTHSVIYNGGNYSVVVKRHEPPEYYPERTPHYC